jgi:spore germination protein GerM
VVPPDTSLRALYLGEDGTAYVDLDAAFARGLSGGSEDALIAVRSIASTLALSLPEVQRVKILIEGEEVNDLGGHLDLSQPLIPEAQPR